MIDVRLRKINQQKTVQSWASVPENPNPAIHGFGN